MNKTNNFTGNPYIFGVPIRNKDQLYGRKKIIEKIENNFRNNQKITLLHVQRRIGKTSLLECLPQFITEEQGFKFVDFSLQGYEYKPIDKILNDLADRIAEVIGILPNQVRELVNNSETFFIEEFLPKIINKYLPGKKLVLLLDEFDILGKDEKMPAGKNLFNTLEKAVEQEENLFAILVFGRPVKDMTYLKEFLKKQTPIEVGLLNRKDTEQLIVKPVQGILKYELGAIEAIWQLSAGHPSLTQLLCFNLFAYCRSEEIKPVVSRHIELILEQTMQEGIYVFEGFLKPLNKPEKLFFRAVAETQEIGIDPLKIIKPTREITTPVLRHAGERLVEYGFLEKLEKQGTSYKIKVELVRRWLLKNYPLSEEEKQKMQKTPQINNPKTFNKIAKFLSLFVVILIIMSTLGYSFIWIRNSQNSNHSRPECSRLLAEINVALGDAKERSRVIEEVRNKWPREKESLDAQCRYNNEFDQLDTKYNELLYKYGWDTIGISEYEKAISSWCEITEEYEKSSDLKKTFVNLISTDGDWNRKKIIETLIEQNQSGNDCLIYSFKNERNKEQLYEQQNKLYNQRNEQYYQEAQNYIKNYEFEKAVESYCKITREYEGFNNIVKQLRGWLFNDPDLFNDERQKVEDKLKQLNNQCVVSPLNN
ncbi:ATP-binding protein [Okeania sp. SIO2B3]|uniref:ATP-binding protein n=1 Tax=Okeania sp. SIO2B3 TaxID=2607784 RepID=UPI0013C01084|nr:ATP-binding protein [Okeania sp. SIO2B3]NET43515.1 ATP-binding protein [Okeania sp. SIO2B3]